MSKKLLKEDIDWIEINKCDLCGVKKFYEWCKIHHKEVIKEYNKEMAED